MCDLIYKENEMKQYELQWTIGEGSKIQSCEWIFVGMKQESFLKSVHW